MDWPKFIPPADFLEKAQGVERGLRQYQRLGRFGWLLGASGIALQAALWGLPKLGQDIPPLRSIVLAFFVLALVGALVTFVFIRLRLQEARKPFRYTCSVLPFKPGEGMQAEDTLDWLAEDLAQKLSERIGRLSFIDPKEEAERRSKLTEFHVHIWGTYVIRDAPRPPGWQASAQASKQRLFIELTPRVRVGSIEASDTLAFPVPFPWLPKQGRIQAGR